MMVMPREVDLCPTCTQKLHLQVYQALHDYAHRSLLQAPEQEKPQPEPPPGSMFPLYSFQMPNLQQLQAYLTSLFSVLPLCQTCKNQQHFCIVTLPYYTYPYQEYQYPKYECPKKAVVKEKKKCSCPAPAKRCVKKPPPPRC